MSFLHLQTYCHNSDWLLEKNRDARGGGGLALVLQPQKQEQTTEQLCRTDQWRHQRTHHLSVVSSWESAADRKPELCFPSEVRLCSHYLRCSWSRRLILSFNQLPAPWMQRFQLGNHSVHIHQASIFMSFITEIRHTRIVNVHDCGVCTKTGSEIAPWKPMKGRHSLWHQTPFFPLSKPAWIFFFFFGLTFGVHTKVACMLVESVESTRHNNEECSHSGW